MKKSMRMVAAITCLGALAGSTGVGERSAVAAAAQERIISVDAPIEILYDARKLVTDVPPENVSGSVLVPIRFVADKLGAGITLTGKHISVVKAAKKLELTIGASTATVNGKSITLNVPVRVTKGRTLVPLRVISEGLGLPIEWDSINQFVWIGDKEVPKLEDIAKKKSIEDAKKYFINVEDLLETYQGKDRLIWEVSQRDLPFIYGGVAYYRFDLAKSNLNNQFVRTISDYSATSFNLLLFNTALKPVRPRIEATPLRKKLNKDINALFYAVVSTRSDEANGIKDNIAYNLSKVDYFYFSDNDSSVFFKNNWR